MALRTPYAMCGTAIGYGAAHGGEASVVRQHAHTATLQAVVQAARKDAAPKVRHQVTGSPLYLNPKTLWTLNPSDPKPSRPYTL
eukprot:1472200-Rhodomonas_salina.2